MSCTNLGPSQVPLLSRRRRGDELSPFPMAAERGDRGGGRRRRRRRSEFDALPIAAAASPKRIDGGAAAASNKLLLQSVGDLSPVGALGNRADSDRNDSPMGC